MDNPEGQVTYPITPLFCVCWMRKRGYLRSVPARATNRRASSSPSREANRDVYFQKSTKLQHNPGIRHWLSGLPFWYCPVTDSELLSKARLSHALFLPAGCYEFSNFDLIHIGHLLSWLKHSRYHHFFTRTVGWFPATLPLAESGKVRSQPMMAVWESFACPKVHPLDSF